MGRGRGIIMAGVSVVGMCAAGVAASMAVVGCDERVLVGNMRPDAGVTGYGGSTPVTSAAASVASASVAAASVVAGVGGHSGIGGSGAGGGVVIGGFSGGRRHLRSRRRGFGGFGGGGFGGGGGGFGGFGGSPVVPPSCSTISTALNQVNPCGHTSGVAYSLDGTLLATGNMDSPTASVHIWRLFDGALVQDARRRLAAPPTTWRSHLMDRRWPRSASQSSTQNGVNAKIYRRRDWRPDSYATRSLRVSTPTRSRSRRMAAWSRPGVKRGGSSSGAPPTARCS